MAIPCKAEWPKLWADDAKPTTFQLYLKYQLQRCTQELKE